MQVIQRRNKMSPPSKVVAVSLMFIATRHLISHKNRMKYEKTMKNIVSIFYF